MSNPITDAVAFLTAHTGDYTALGQWRWLVLAVFWAFALGSFVVAIVNWNADPTQRNGTNLWFFLVRFLVGCMWFEGTLWKLPFGPDNGLHYWTEQMAGRAAFAVHAQLVKDVVLPWFSVFNPLVYLAELFFAASFMLGFLTRLGGLAAALFTLNLWLGIYNQRPGDPAEWSWSYMFLALLCGTFCVAAAGRALGVDAWLRRDNDAVRSGRGLGGLVRALT